MRIATFNVNSIRSRLDTVLDWLAKNRPDVLCLQETKTPDADFPAVAIRSARYHVLFRGEPKYNGVAIVSRVQPDEKGFGLDGGTRADETRLAWARFGDVWVVNTYVPQGRDIEHEMYAYKLEWFKRLRLFFEKHLRPDWLVAWVGDLNIAPEAKDIHNAEKQAHHVCFHHEARKAFERTKAWGFEDVFRRHHPEGGQYSYFDYRQKEAVERGLGWRVDHILATKPLAERSTDAFIDLAPRRAERPSDHAPVIADFRLPSSQ